MPVQNKSLALCAAAFMLFALSLPPIQAQQPSPKREFRGAWVATVLSLDYPDRPTTWPVALKEDWKNLVAGLKATGLNAVIVQVRPAADAFYPSRYAPWSAYLTGQQGLPPEKGFDPLEFMIAEAHRQGLEFHAWLNPYRASMNLDTTAFAPGHVFHQHRKWLRSYGGRYYLDPGIPAVRHHLSNIVAELAAQYDIDGLHFDDYFYPYPVADAPFPDSSSFARYGARYDSVADWRRFNVDRLIQMTDSTLARHKPFAQFGVSPFGVWRNLADDPRGSATQASVSTYDHLYADVLRWAQQGWVDYLVPQLYWHRGFEPADHTALQEWWGKYRGKARLYIGHAAYRAGNSTHEQWRSAGELPAQMKLGRANPEIEGAVFFRAASLLENRLGTRDSIQHLYALPALLPARPGASDCSSPRLKKAKTKRKGNLIRWKDSRGTAEARQFVIYRFEGQKVGSLEEARAIRYISPANRGQRRHKFIDGEAQAGKAYTYIITAVDRARRESLPSRPAVVQP